MTATNQAFIKAYRQDPPSPTPGPPALAGGQPPASVDLGPLVQFVSAGAACGAATFVTAMPAPLPEVVEAWPYQPSCAEHAPQSAPHWQRESPAVKRPLSSFRAAPSRSTAMPVNLSCGTTVPSFRWPTVCQAISRDCAGPLDRVVDILQSRADEARTLVGVASLHAGEGATTTLLCLAARLATRGKRTIVVEGNFAAPCLAQRLGVAPTGHWQDVLERGTPVGDVVIRATSDQLDLLPLDARQADAARLAAGLQASVTAGVLRYAYELVLIDLGAILSPRTQPVALELVLNMRVDSALLVTRPGAAPSSVAAAAKMLENHACELLGTVENRVLHS